MGLAAAGTQGGAVIGTLLGDWIVDKIGRRAVFLSTVGMFVVFALAPDAVFVSSDFKCDRACMATAVQGHTVLHRCPTRLEP